MNANIELPIDLANGFGYLAAHGLNIVHIFDTQQIADLVQPAIPELDLADYPSAVLIASGGPQIWRAVQQHELFKTSEPIDNFSTLISLQFLTMFLDTEAYYLYPSDLPIPLGRIGHRAGWSFQSPMGISIHPEFGTWFAYRTMFLLKDHVAQSDSAPFEHPCNSCEDKPCISACPSGAVGEIGQFGMDDCSLYRIKDQSPCSFTCISRTRCPVGAEFQYLPEQLEYFYKRSRKTLKRHYANRVER